MLGFIRSPRLGLKASGLGVKALGSQQVQLQESEEERGLLALSALNPKPYTLNPESS